MASRKIRRRAMVSIVFRLVVCEAHGSGSSSAVSRSKRRNVMATRKNFIEKGRRADPMGSNLKIPILKYGFLSFKYTQSLNPYTHFSHFQHQVPWP